MVPQLQLQWVGVQIILLFQIRLIVFPHVVIDKRDGDYKGNVALRVLADNLQHLFFFIGGKVFLEISHHVLKNVGVFLDC